MNRDRLIAILEAYLVTFLWSSSYIIVKIELKILSPLTLVALRYIVASIILVPLALLKGGMTSIKKKRDIAKTLFLGFSGYTIAQGLQSLGLFYLPAVSVTFILNLTPIIVLILGIVLLREYPSVFQLVGMGLVIVGASLFFGGSLSASSFHGVLITLLSGFGWAVYMVSSRILFVKEKMNPLYLTAFSMGSGTSLIAVIAYSIEGLSNVSLSSWVIILWLAAINTAFAFFLWNHALQRIEVFEISILQNTMLIQIALMSWIFLGEQLTLLKLVSIFLVFIGVLIVQLKRT